MQELFTELFWESEEIPEKAARLCGALPGFDAAQRDYVEITKRIQSLVGYPLYDQFEQRFLRYTGYEVRAYYALGLGLREQVVQSLGL